MISTQAHSLMIDYTAVDIWWRSAQNNHRLYFRLVQETTHTLEHIPNYDRCIHILEIGHRKLLRAICPREAKVIRQYLISSTRHLIGCLHKLRDGEIEDGADLLGQASLEMDLLRYELMNMGLK
jgi:hypothetical protein